MRRLAQAGAAVVLTGRGLEPLKRVESDINATGGEALGMQADLRQLKASSQQKVIDQAIELELGSVDILVNNAAVFPPSIFIDVSEETFDHDGGHGSQGRSSSRSSRPRAMIAAGRGGASLTYLSTGSNQAHRVPVRLMARPSSGCGRRRKRWPRSWPSTEFSSTPCHPRLGIITQERIVRKIEGPARSGLDDLPEDASVKTPRSSRRLMKARGRLHGC